MLRFCSSATSCLGLELYGPTAQRGSGFLHPRRGCTVHWRNCSHLRLVSRPLRFAQGFMARYSVLGGARRIQRSSRVCSPEAQAVASREEFPSPGDLAPVSSGICSYTPITATNSFTEAALLSSAAFSSGVSLISMICSIPLAPNFTGTPTYRPFNPYSPSR